ncbi:hypothetical protein EG68_07601 [Paragonimus skrjabini miyazakii]|uniref:Hexosyltransferase n=1 Tax=Paragonimus skrjabini miyazakii TaxID=59628 RepID=A0A8S9YR23_9TREM|nr:hypothetical protein EG68_07601 [Paragonimus skrjabini miyazakii]
MSKLMRQLCKTTKYAVTKLFSRYNQRLLRIIWIGLLCITLYLIFLRNSETVVSEQPMPYRFVLMKQQLCSASVKPTVLIVIRSTPNQRIKRDAIRTTWGNPCTYDTQRVELFFLVGKHTGLKSASVDLDLQLEFQRFRDIVQYDSADSYRLLPNKQQAAFHLINKQCSNFPFVFMTDEDFLVNISNLVDHILQLHINDYISFVGGHLYGNSVPIRDNTSKYYLSLESYPNRTLPPFVAGGATLMAISLTGKILSEMSKLKTKLHLEDVNLGLVLKKLGVMPRNIRTICILEEQCNSIPLHQRIAVHGYNTSTKLREDWQKLNVTVDCSK